MEHTSTPTVLCLSRQGVPTLDNSSAEKVAKGAYIAGEYGCDTKTDIIFVSTGTEVSLAINTAKELSSTGLGVR